jgi:periplasmic divalent cation tolerance protein
VSVSLVLSTAPNKAVARKIASTLLKKRLCACVNISSVAESHYWWQGKIESAKEVLLTLKTSKKALPLLLKNLKQIHPYETPEILAIDVRKADPTYLRWILKETKP